MSDIDVVSIGFILLVIINLLSNTFWLIVFRRNKPEQHRLFEQIETPF